MRAVVRILRAKPMPPSYRRTDKPIRPVKITSWMGGEHWYVGDVQYLHLEDAIAYCERIGSEYEIVEDPNYVHTWEGD